MVKLKNNKFGDFILISGKYRRVFIDSTHEHVLRVAQSAPNNVKYEIIKLT